MTLRSGLRLLWALAMLAAPVVRAQDQTGVERPGAARRLVHLFDFNAREKYALPQYWELAQDGAGRAPRPGFPVYNGAEQDLTVAYEGTGSVRLFSKGGSTCLRLQPGVLPVFPQTEYIVAARVQTRGMRHARAALVARFLDKTNAPIPGTEVRGELVATAPGEWRLVHCTLPGSQDGAAYIQIDLAILQPEQFTAPQLGVHQVWTNEFPVDAWFDDVAVTQLPRVTMATNDPANIILRPLRPAISISLRDLTGEALTGRIVVQDAAGSTVDQTTNHLSGGAEKWMWEPTLSALGWYRATLELTTGSRRVGGTYVDFLWLPEGAQSAAQPGAAPLTQTIARSADRARFWIVLDELPAVSRESLAGILARLGTGAVAFPVWSADQTPETVLQHSKDLLPLVMRLKNQWQQVSFTLPRIPDQLATAAHLEPDQALTALGMDQKAWLPYLLPLLDRYGQMVQRWQVGRAGDPPPRTPDAAAALARFESALAKLVPGPTVALPWPAELSPAGNGAHDILATLPYASPPEGIADLIAAWRPSLAGGEMTMALEPLPEGQFSRRDSAIHLVKQAVEFWSAMMPLQPAAGGFRGSLALVQPWDWPTATRAQTMPRAEAAAYANLARCLSDRRVAGKLPVAPGVECYILAPAPGAPGRTGALVAWSQGAPPERAVIDAYLGDGAVSIVDMWGNSHPVTLGEDEPAARRPGGPLTHRVPLTDEPIFIENVEVGLAQFIASFHLEPDFAPATASEHELALVVANPFQSRAQGRITILEPGGLSKDPTARDRSWRISPRSSTFSIAPGETARIPITMSFSPVEEAGLKPFLAEVELAADRDYGVFRLNSTFEVRLDTIQMDLSYRILPGTQDLVVEAHITNKGTAPATFELSAFAPGLPRSRASIADLPPSDTATRRFAFPGAATKLRGERVVVGAQDAETQSRITRSIPIE